MSIKVQAINKRYNEQQVLSDMSFELSNNEIVGFLGPNGAGKSTTMKIITGFLRPDSGSATICGHDILQNPIEAKRLIGYLPEHNPLYLDMYVTEYLDYAASFYPLNEKRRDAVRRVIEQTGLEREYKKKIRQLSKGYRQRVGLAQALVHNPQVLILDEPTTGLDPNQLLEIRQLIKAIGKEKTVLFSTHIMQEVEAICQRAIVINRGTIVADAPLAELKASPSQQHSFVIEFDQPFNFSWSEVSPDILEAQPIGACTYRITASDDIRAAVSAFAHEHSLTLLTLQKEQQGLERQFIEIIHQLQ